MTCSYYRFFGLRGYVVNSNWKMRLIGKQRYTEIPVNLTTLKRGMDINGSR